MRSQLTAASISNIGAGTWEADYHYKKDGNIYQKVVGTETTDYSYDISDPPDGIDDGDLMISATGQENFTLDWDYNGNMTTGVNPTFVYNWDNKLRSASIIGGDSIDSIKYDPDGNRIYKESTVSSQSVKRKYIVDVAGRLPVILLVMDADNDNSVVSSYVYANSQVLAQYDGEQKQENDKHFYLHDRLGSVRQVLDSSGNVANTYTYTPFGQDPNNQFAETVGNPFRFTGQWYDDEIAQYYLRARMYDPQIMRFTSIDPVRGKLYQPLTLHEYLYCSNDPLNRIDPGGRLFLRIIDRLITRARIHRDSVNMASLGDDYLDQSIRLANSAAMYGSAGYIPICPVPLPKNPADGFPAPWEPPPPGSNPYYNWHNFETGESMWWDADLQGNHPEYQDGHWDYVDPEGKHWRVDPETGEMTPKKN